MYKYIYTNIQHRSVAVHELISNVYCSLIRLIVVVLALRHGLTTLNKPKSRQVYTNDGIITQNIFNAAVSTSVEFKTNTNKLYFCEYLISTRCLLHPGYQI